MNKYPLLNSIMNQQVLEEDLNIAELGNALLNYLFMKVTLLKFKDVKIYESISPNFSEFIAKSLNVNESSFSVKMRMGLVTKYSQEKVSEIQKEIQRMLLEEDYSMNNSFMYEEKTMFEEEITQIPLRRQQSENSQNKLEIISVCSEQKSRDFSFMSQESSYYGVLMHVKNKQKTQVEKYLSSIKNFSEQLNILSQKLKFQLGEWEKEEEKGVFKMKNVLYALNSFQYVPFTGEGVGRSIKAGKEMAAKEIIEKLYKNSPYLMHAMKEIHEKQIKK